MRAHGYAPNVISFSAAISACEKAGGWERALELLDEVRAAPDLEPNVITFIDYSIAADTFAEGKSNVRRMKLEAGTYTIKSGKTIISDKV